MLSLSEAAKLEKNKLSAGGVWLTLLQISLTDGTNIRLCSNTEDITWPTPGGDLWQAFPFELDALMSSSKGEIPSLVLRVSNVTGIVGSYIELGKGGIGAIVRIRIVHSEHLDLTTPELDEIFDVTASQVESEWVTITLGAPNPLLARFPRNKYLRNHCRWIFKSTECGYAGADTTCQRNLAACRLKNNQLRFGGFPGIPGGGLFKI